MIAEHRANYGGDHVEDDGDYMGPGIDPNLYRATAGDVSRLLVRTLFSITACILKPKWLKCCSGCQVK